MSTDNLPTPSPIQPNSPETASELTVVLAFEGMAEYVAAAKADPDSDLAPLFREHVVEPYWQQCAEGGEYEALASRELSNPMRDLDQLEQMVQALADSEIEKQITAAFEQAKRHFPGGNTTVCVFAADPARLFIRDRMYGVTGLTAGVGKIWLQIYPEGEWKDWVGYTVAHEYHHSAWTAQNYDEKQPFYLIDYLAFEGRADAFAHLVYPERTAPWTEVLNEEDEMSQWETIRDKLKTTGGLADYMFGNPEREIPLWTGYTIGFHIVQGFIEKNPELSITEWSAMAAMDILEEGGYGKEE